MKLLKLTIFLSILIISQNLNAQQKKYEYLFDSGDTLIKDTRFYFGITHQHHDFFNKAFSYQGIETGAILNHKLMVGVYASSFVSNLLVDIKEKNTYFSLAQGGLVLGVIYNKNQFLHTGMLINMGYVSIIGNGTPFPLFKPGKPPINISGAVIAPQLFAELNIIKWMKISGLAYNFYSFQDQSIVTKEDLENISFTFGFIFGKFY